VNTTKHIEVNRRRTLVGPAVAFILVVACAVVPIRTEGAAAAQTPVVADAKHVDHGLVLTIGDVLFTSGKADLKPAAVGSLNKLVTFLTQYPGHSVAIHGYTDSVGSEEYNQGLSERRANSVKAYLAAQGIGSTRLSASGMGQSDPVAGNDSGVGRQQNRRVEVIISNPPATAPAVLTPRARTARMLALLALLESLSGNTGRPLF
jgi:outer membrane protein OmpA-like peptidoglycan-associated protein